LHCLILHWWHLWVDPLVSARLMFNFKWAIFQLYHYKNKLHSMRWRWCPFCIWTFIVLDILLHLTHYPHFETTCHGSCSTWHIILETTCHGSCSTWQIILKKTCNGSCSTWHTILQTTCHGSCSTWHIILISRQPVMALAPLDTLSSRQPVMVLTL
jgi:hypothetical protein